MTAKTISTILDAITSHARAMRAVGIMHVEFNGVKIDLTPDNAQGSSSEQVPELDALNDPFTYGLPPGARVPGYSIDKDES